MLWLLQLRVVSICAIRNCSTNNKSIFGIWISTKKIGTGVTPITSGSRGTVQILGSTTIQSSTDFSVTPFHFISPCAPIYTILIPQYLTCLYHNPTHIKSNSHFFLLIRSIPLYYFCISLLYDQPQG